MDKIRGPIKASVDKLIAKMKGDKRTPKKREKDKAQKKEDKERVRKQKQGKAGQYADKIQEGIKQKKDADNSKVFKATGLTAALSGNKIGNLGVNLDNVDALKEKEEARDKKQNANKLEKLAEKQSEADKALAEKQEAFNAKYGKSKDKGDDPDRAKAEKELAKARDASHKLKKEAAEVRKDDKDIDKAAAKREKDKETKARQKELKKQGLSDSAIATRLKVEGNIPESKQARESSNFGEHVEREGEVEKGIGGGGNTSTDNPLQYSRFGSMDKEEGERYRNWNYDKIREISYKNPKSDHMTLGKYIMQEDKSPSPAAYSERAKATGDSYFDLGNQWGEIKKNYNLTDDDMFEKFNVPALDRAVAEGKVIRFTHDPRDYKESALESEWKFLRSQHGYRALKQEGDYWYAIK